MPITRADIETEYAKNEDLKKEDVETLKQWIEKQPHLPEITELQLILFLQSCYSKMELTKTTIDTFFYIKTHYTDFFGNRDPNLLRTRESMDCGVFYPLPKQTPEGYRILFFSFMDGDASNFNFVDQVKIFDMNLRLWLEEDGTSPGLVIVLNMDKFGFMHLAKLGITPVKNLVQYLQDALPVRLKGLHFINSGAVIDRLMAMIRPFLKKELLEIVNAMKEKLLDNVDYFLQDEKQVTDESKRTDKETNCLFQEHGLNGSFKKLEVD